MTTLIERLRELDNAKKPYPSGAVGQMMGCESYRLVATGFAFQVLQEAADTIEALQAEVERMREDWNHLALKFAAERDALRAERDALQAEVERKGMELMIALSKQQDLSIACEQLRAELDALKAQEPVAWPTNAHEIREFIGSNFNTRTDDGEPNDSDKYSLTAHDLLSSFSEWAESAALKAPTSLTVISSYTPDMDKVHQEEREWALQLHSQRALKSAGAAPQAPAPKQAQEPVAWHSDDWKIIIKADQKVFWPVAKNPLHAGAAPQAPAPLTNEQMGKLYRQSALQDRIVVRSDWEQGLRDGEKAHGIGEAQG